MQITLSGKEFDRAMESYVNSLGFSTSKYVVKTKTVVGRGEYPTTTVIIDLEEKEIIEIPTMYEPKIIPLSEQDIKAAESISQQTRKFGQVVSND